MKIAVYPFASTGAVADNLANIRQGIALAAAAHVRLLVFHECALCGYPPLETTAAALDDEAICAALAEIGALAKTCRMYIAVGTARMEGNLRRNSMVIFDDKGEEIGSYDKRALWGWDVENFARGDKPGVFEIDGCRVGFRLCFDVRFPELFRELYRQGAELCFVSFSDAQPQPSPERYEIIRAHLMTRAMENVMPVISVNTLSGCPAAPTAVFDRNGHVVEELAPGEARLLTYDFVRAPYTFGERGRIENNRLLLDQIF